jgi:hypothetical protein
MKRCTTKRNENQKYFLTKKGNTVQSDCLFTNGQKRNKLFFFRKSERKKKLGDRECTRKTEQEIEK